MRLKQTRIARAHRCYIGALVVLGTQARHARAQAVYELGAGSNVVASAPAGDRYSHGFNLRASIGRETSRRFEWRFDAFATHYEHVVRVCASEDLVPGLVGNPPSCPGESLLRHSERLDGVSLEGITPFAPHGILYVLYGAGVYVLDFVRQGGASNLLLKSTLVRVGPSAGAGVQIPVAGGRAFAEVLARVPIRGPSHPDLILPVIVGFRR